MDVFDVNHNLHNVLNDPTVYTGDFVLCVDNFNGAKTGLVVDGMIYLDNQTMEDTTTWRREKRVYRLVMDNLTEVERKHYITCLNYARRNLCGSKVLCPKRVLTPADIVPGRTWLTKTGEVIVYAGQRRAMAVNDDNVLTAMYKHMYITFRVLVPTNDLLAARESLPVFERVNYISLIIVAGLLSGNVQVGVNHACIVHASTALDFVGGKPVRDLGVLNLPPVITVHELDRVIDMFDCTVTDDEVDHVVKHSVK